MYPEHIVKPMKEELISNGFSELKNNDNIKDLIKSGIENAYNAGEINFNKPISCHLYPLRITELKNYTAINYHDWDICNSACVKGENDNVYVFEFLKSALIRKFGNDWYEKLLTAKKTNS